MTNPEFILAQQRVISRRLGQENRSHEPHHTDSSRAYSPSVADTQILTPLIRLRNLLNSTWECISGREGTQPSFRVGQVDAELLDEELLSLLKAQVSDGLKYYGSHLQDEWAPEIMLVLRSILFKLTVWDHDATYGAALQNLRFSNAQHGVEGISPPSNRQKLAYGLLTTGAPYAWTRWTEWLVKRNRGHDSPSQSVKILSKIYNLLDTFHSVAGFVNFLIFLVNGRYRTLLDRLLRLRLASPNNQLSRQVSFEYLNRQLVWHAFTEFLLFFLPLVGVNKWRKWFMRTWRKIKSMIMKGVEGKDDAKSGQLAFLPKSICAICYYDQNPQLTSEAEAMAALGSTGGINSTQTNITNPYESIPCGCVYCFVCIASRLEAEDGDAWICLRCSAEGKECKPWSGDVTEDESRPMIPSKTVLFSEPDSKTAEIESNAADREHDEVEKIHDRNVDGHKKS